MANPGTSGGFIADVEQAAGRERVELVRSLTRQMLTDPSRRIDLDELLTHEARSVLAFIKSDDFGAGPDDGSNLDEVGVARRAIETWEAVEPFCTSLQLAARHSTPEALTPWRNGIRAFVQTAAADVGGYQALTDLRHLPGALAIVTAAVAATTSQRWDNLRTLVVNASVPNRHMGTQDGLLEVTDPYAAFGHGGTTAELLRYANNQEMSVEETAAALVANRHRLGETPAGPFEWFCQVLAPVFADQLADEDSWRMEFNRAEVFLGILAEDVHLRRVVASAEGRAFKRTHWVGRAANRMLARSEGGPVQDWAFELHRDGQAWGPLVAGLFGGDVDRAAAAIEAYGEVFAKAVSGRW